MSGNSEKRQKWTVERFYKEATEVHGDKYEYEDLVDVKVSTRLTVKCKKHGRVFYPSVADHIYKESGCPSCKGETSGLTRKELGICSSREEFIRRAVEVHGDKYDYSRAVVGSTRDKVTVVCRVPGHGEFYPTPTNHVHSATGCPVCGQESTTSKRTDSQEKFISDCVAVHGDKYDYSKTVYVTAHVPITITCHKHGDFTQIAYDNKGGHGCSSCSFRSSKPQRDIEELVRSAGISLVRDYKLPSGLEIDVYCPELNVGIEHNGLYWHSTAAKVSSVYHLRKTLQAEREGIRLIHVFEDEWVWNKMVCTPWILSKLGVYSFVDYARRCVVKTISWSECKDFVDSHHIQGAGSACSTNLGLFNKSNVLVGVMAFANRSRIEGAEEVELVRFCTEGRVIGGFQKLLAHFIRSYSGSATKLVSFSDTRWSRGEVYEKSGFIKEKVLRPDYYWTKGQRRYDKSMFRHSRMADTLRVYDPSLSERENCEANGYYKIYDCGKVKWTKDLG